jgi:hypothetical protein
MPSSLRPSAASFIMTRYVHSAFQSPQKAPTTA